ncbi:Kynurenine 3monooxygenase, partial [Caligus rogercresseyi]
MEHVPGRSINLALSVRGLSGLNLVGLHDHMKNHYGLPMYCRKIHKTNGDMYDAILSIGRRYLNEILITKGDSYPNLHMHFEHKLWT